MTIRIYLVSILKLKKHIKPFKVLNIAIILAERYSKLLDYAMRRKIRFFGNTISELYLQCYSID